MFRPSLLIVAAVVTCVVPVAAFAQTKGPGATNRQLDAIKRSPLVFYFAKGQPGACGEGCSEWIAAEGYFDRDAPQRLRTLLARIPGQAPPIFFQSHGGIQAAALSIGRQMRRHGMTAGVGRTIPDGCATPTGDQVQACQTVKKSGQKVTAELRAVGSDCSSACVYALIGAKVRQVPVGARLGIHAGKLVQIFSDGRVRSPSQVALSVKLTAHVREQELRGYVREMGVSVQLVDAAVAVAHESLRFLDRDEIIRFGIDGRDFLESPWSVDQAEISIGVVKIVQAVGVLKTLEMRRPDNDKIRRTILRFSCKPQSDMTVQVLRESGEAGRGAATSLRLEGGGRSVSVRLGGGDGSRDIQARYNVEVASVPLAFFNDPVETIELAEAADPDGAEKRKVAISTRGFDVSSAALLRRCRDPGAAPSANVPVGRM
jgi:hypothetical protein